MESTGLNSFLLHRKNKKHTWCDALQNKMSPLARKRILLLAIFLFPIVVIALFLIFGKSPQDPASTLPVMPPR
jgi:uncharacterized membrane protein YvbJ